MNYDKLESLAKEKGISKSHLCQLVGRERYYLRDCKKNNAVPPENHMQIWADALSTTVDYLTDKTEQKEKPADTSGEQFMNKLQLLDVEDLEKINSLIDELLKAKGIDTHRQNPV